MRPDGFTARNDRGAQFAWRGPWNDLSLKPLAFADFPESGEPFLAAWGGATVEEALYEPADRRR